MSASETVGGLIGSNVGAYGGGIVGGAIGELFGPEAVPLGAFLGSKAGSYLGRAAGAAIASEMENANEKAKDKTKVKQDDQSQACSTCDPCKQNAQKIQDVQDELENRYDELLNDQHDLFSHEPNPIPGKEFLGTWHGHQQQFEDKQRLMIKKLNEANKLGCKTSDEGLKWATEPTPKKPSSKS